MLEIFLGLQEDIDRGLSTITMTTEQSQQLKQPGKEHAVFISTVEVVLPASTIRSKLIKQRVL